jgi:hypothetical protein
MLAKRQKIGLALMAASVLAAIVVQLLTNKWVKIHLLKESLPSGGFTVDMVFHFGWRYEIPLLLCFAAGFICLVLSSRKPPQLDQPPE